MQWVVIIGRGSWAKCYGPFQSYDECIHWAKQNQFIEAGSYEAYPVNAIQHGNSENRDAPLP